VPCAYEVQSTAPSSSCKRRCAIRFRSTRLALDDRPSLRLHQSSLSLQRRGWVAAATSVLAYESTSVVLPSPFNRTGRPGSWVEPLRAGLEHVEMPGRDSDNANPHRVCIFLPTHRRVDRDHDLLERGRNGDAILLKVLQPKKRTINAEYERAVVLAPAFDRVLQVPGCDVALVGVRVRASSAMPPPPASPLPADEIEPAAPVGVRSPSSFAPPPHAITHAPDTSVEKGKASLMRSKGAARAGGRAPQPWP